MCSVVHDTYKEVSGERILIIFCYNLLCVCLFMYMCVYAFKNMSWPRPWAPEAAGEVSGGGGCGVRCALPHPPETAMSVQKMSGMVQSSYKM